MTLLEMSVVYAEHAAVIRSRIVELRGLTRQETDPEAVQDNSADLDRLRRNLRFARQQVLTKRQQQMLELYYDQGLTMGQIAAKLHLNRSTVCRTLQRARERLYACLRYTL